MDIKTFEEQAETRALLKLLALGNEEIEAGQFRGASEVLADLEGEES